MVLLTYLYVHTCMSVIAHVPFFGVMFVRGVEYSSKQLSLCFAGLMSALNFNDTSIKIGADVSQLAESQVEERGESRVSKIECIVAAQKS